MLMPMIQVSPKVTAFNITPKNVNAIERTINKTIMKVEIKIAFSLLSF